MAYATRADLEQRHGADEVEQRESALPAGAVDRALADAEALIDGYLVGRYSLPLTPVPANLPRVACAIARYHLLGDAVTERATEDHKNAIAWLKDVASGRVLLQGAAVEPGNDPATVVMVTGDTAVFKRSGRP
jgi:phage gp36-like protein